LASLHLSLTTGAASAAAERHAHAVREAAEKLGAWAQTWVIAELEALQHVLSDFTSTWLS
jgi:hypothetical protein